MQQTIQQPLAMQHVQQQPLAMQQVQPLGVQQIQPLGVQQAAQPIQAVGATTTFSQPAGIATSQVIEQPLYQGQAQQGFSQQHFQQESRRFENIPTAREAGNWNQLGEYGWYNQAGGQQISSQQATGQQLYQAEPIVQQQGFSQASSQQASFAAPQQFASSTTGTNLAATQGSNLGGYSWYNEQPTGQGSNFAQPMASSNLGQASSWAEPSSMGQASSINQAASSFEQQAVNTAASSFNQPMGQAASELGRAATQSVEGSLSRGVQGGSQFLPSAAPVGTGAR
jgi:hypothetical protein